MAAGAGLPSAAHTSVGEGTLMARRGWSTANFLRGSSAVVTGAPFTIAVWFKSSITLAQQEIFGLFNSANDQDFVRMNLAGSDQLAGTFGDLGSGGFAFGTSTTFTASAWQHGCLVKASVNSQIVYLNGGGKATNTNNSTPAGLNRTSMGVYDGATGPSGPFAPAGTGDLAEVAVYNVALGDADVLSLSRNIRPHLIRPDKLIAYWQLIGKYGPEINLKSNSATLAIQGTLTQSAHPRMLGKGSSGGLNLGLPAAPASQRAGQMFLTF